MFDRSGLQQAWNHIARQQLASAQPDGEVVAFVEHLSPQPQLGASVLDVGCGQGRNALYLSQRGFTVHGCDLSPVAIKAAKVRVHKKRARVSFQIADLVHLPYADSSFTVAVCVHMLPYHLRADLTKGVRELRRILQPGGWLYLDLLDHTDREYGHGQQLEPHTFLDPSGLPLHFSSRQEINELLPGFALKRMTTLELSANSPPRVAWIIWATKLPDPRMKINR